MTNLPFKLSNSLSLSDVFQIVSYYKKKIFSFVVIVAVLTAVMVFFVMDPIFLSTSTVKTTTKLGGLGSLLGGGIPDIGDIGDLTGGGSGAKELALYESILTSRKCIEATIIKFKLNEEWEFKYMQDAIKNFKENILEIKKDKIAGTLEISIYDKDPQRAKEINEFLISELNNINTDLNVLNARNNREFVESRYKIAKEDLRKAEDSLRNYQDIYGIAPDLTVKVAAQSEIQLETEIKSEEVKLELLTKILSPDQAEIKAQNDKIAALKSQLNKIQNSTDINETLKIKGAPQMVLAFIRLQRDVEIQNKILTFIIPLLEQAKIDEKKEMPSVLVLDSPFIPEKKVKPKRLTLVALSIVGSFFFIVIFYILLIKFRNFRSNYKVN